MFAVSTREEAQPLDVMVELISRMDGAADESPRVFYDRLCAGLCELTSMTRAGLLLYDDLRKLVLPAGSHGVEPWLLDQVHGTLEETPVAQKALSEDRVVVVSQDLAAQIPPRYAELGGFTTLTCTPVSAGGRWLGVIFADRGGGQFDLTDNERRTMWTLGKTAALAASVRTGTTAHERSRLLAQRVDVAREVHDRVMQRLFGVSLVLGSAVDLSQNARARAAQELQEAVADLRTVLARSPEARSSRPDATLRDELDRLARHYERPIELEWQDGLEVPADLEGLSQAVLAEALHNADKHARPELIGVRVAAPDGAFVMEVTNDGVSPGRSGTGAGMGLRLAALDALARGGVVEFGPAGEGLWRVRMLVPLEESE